MSRLFSDLYEPSVLSTIGMSSSIIQGQAAVTLVEQLRTISCKNYFEDYVVKPVRGSNRMQDNHHKTTRSASFHTTDIG